MSDFTWVNKDFTSCKLTNSFTWMFSFEFLCEIEFLHDFLMKNDQNLPVSNSNKYYSLIYDKIVQLKWN